MTYTLAVDFIHKTCCYKDCSVMFAMTKDFYKKVRNDPNHWWYCPEGHRQHYTQEQTDAAKLERSRARETALQDQLSAAIRDAETTRVALLRDRQRFANGVCPCCNRTFQNVLRHMKGEHPDYDITKVKQAPVRSFKCSCGRGFASLQGLRIHQGWARPTNWDAPNASRWSSHLTSV